MSDTDKLMEEIKEKEFNLEQAKKTVFTDVENAMYFTNQHADKLLFDHKRERWLLWKDHIWEEDRMGEVVSQAIAMTQKMISESRECAKEEPEKAGSVYVRAKKLQGRAKMANMIELSKNVVPIQNDGNGFDRQPLLLAVANGVINLSDGTFREGKQSDLISLRSPVVYDVNAECPRFMQFMDEIFSSNQDFVSYMQKCLGYTISGSRKEQVFFMGYGTGQNGKNKLIEVIAYILGDYACAAAAKTFKKNEWDTQTNDIAQFDRKRFIYYTETAQSGLNEELLKDLTGSETVKARFLHKEFFEFDPIAKIWLMFNEKPEIKDTSFGFWRRIRFIPFLRQFSKEERDENLGEKLKAEASGILNWLIDGFRMWQETGLNPTPEIVNEAIVEYQAENDKIANFITEACETGVGMEVQASALFAKYELWCNKTRVANSERLSSTAFGRLISKKFSFKGGGTSKHPKLYQGIQAKYMIVEEQKTWF